MVHGAQRCVRARCICGAALGRPSRGRCYYLDGAGEVYLEHGPFPGQAVGATEAAADLRSAAHGGWLMTVGGQGRCLAFPREYVVCACDSDVCLPLAYARRFPELGLVSDSVPHAASYRIGHHLVAVTLGVPLLLVALALFGATAYRGRNLGGTSD
jgi:hypothetical protein